MSVDNHKHLSYEDIEKYSGATEEDFSWDNLDFFKNFEKKLENCEVCKKRFGAYMMFSKLEGDGLMPEAEAGEVPPAAAEEPEGMIERLRKYLDRVGDVVFGNLEVSLPLPMLARGDGASIGGVKQLDGFVEFEVSGQDSAQAVVRIPPQAESTREYKLCVWNAADLENAGEAGAVGMYDITENMDSSMSATATGLECGKYIAAIVEMR